MENREPLKPIEEKDMTILVVDDEENVLKSIRRLLRREPYRVLTALSGREGLKILAENEVHLIISDQRMEGMTGIEFLEEAKKICPDAIRIILTGYAELKVVEEAINRVEIYRFLNKPWSEEDLKNTIRQGLLQWKLKEENRRLFKVIEEQNRKLKRYNETLEQMVEERTRELKEAQAQLVQSEKMASLGVLAGGVAHELNNPLGGIIGIAQLLLMKYPDHGELTEDLKTIEQAGKHCSSIIDNLLKFARKGDPLEKKALSIPALIDDIQIFIGHLLRKKRIRLEKDFPPGLPALLANEQLMKQVFLNLLTNALQAMDKPGVITVRARQTQEGALALEVEDEGPGIPPELADKIFDPFFTTKPEGEGTGLGLSMVYRIIKEHGGEIEVDPRPGEGARFRITFPASAAVKLPEMETGGLGQADGSAKVISFPAGSNIPPSQE